MAYLVLDSHAYLNSNMLNGLVSSDSLLNLKCKQSFHHLQYRRNFDTNLQVFVLLIGSIKLHNSGKTIVSQSECFHVEKISIQTQEI